MSAVQRALLPRLGPLLVLLYCCSPVRWVVWGLQRREDKGIFFGAGGTRVGGGVARTSPPPPFLYVPTEGESCLREEKREEGVWSPLFSNCVFMSPLTVSVPQHFTMEAIVCLGEKAWVFCFNHFSKSYVWHAGGSALPVVGGRLVLCAHFPASLLASVLSALCVVPLEVLVYCLFTPVEILSDAAATLWIIFVVYS